MKKVRVDASLAKGVTCISSPGPKITKAVKEMYLQIKMQNLDVGLILIVYTLQPRVTLKMGNIVH